MLLELRCVLNQHFIYNQTENAPLFSERTVGAFKPLFLRDLAFYSGELKDKPCPALRLRTINILCFYSLQLAEKQRSVSKHRQSDRAKLIILFYVNYI